MLDSKHLHTLAAIVDQGGFASAAQHLGVMLAAVSQRIRALEEQLGQRLLVRGKTVRPTPAGQAVLAHVRQMQVMEADLLARYAATAESGRWQTLPVAVNADSVTTWFLPGVAPLLARQRLLLNLRVDDQDHTNAALLAGEVLGCVSTLSKPLRACVADPLGVMRYRCVAAPAVAQRVQRGGRLDVHALLDTPALIFSPKDALQDQFLERHLGLRQPQYPRHHLPASDGYAQALDLGLGWGMVATQQLDARPAHAPPLIDLLPGCTCDVALYWQHWQRESETALRLTRAVQQAAQRFGLQETF
ncbi:HTH-type transcriptional regulator ArgP [Amphibiibacter pelophylacis]|uniref:HTH-type transcriptional regulator ArgP n=1 Tax=Amphibiibacter pelophylacis TaxID=1799477 RepID=A0ACC6P5V3_9BURK